MVIEKLLVALGIDAGDYVGGLDQAAGQTSSFVDKVTGTVGPAIAGAFVAGGVAATAFAATSISAASDFEAGMLNFASVTGSSITDAGLTLDDFKQKFLDLGAQTSFSAAQAQQAAIELAKGGVPIIDVMNGATDATLSLASAGSVELAEAAGIVAKQLGVWSDTGVTAADVADLMAQAANASTVDVDELALGMANVGGIAKVAGVSFQETTQTLAMISSGFSSASDAGTSLKTFLARLQPTTDSASIAMRELGLTTTSTTQLANYLSDQGIKPLGTDIDTLGNQLTEWATAQGMTSAEIEKLWNSFDTSVFYDQQGNFVGMAQAAELLHNATSGLSEAEKTMAFNTIFGSDALRAAALIAENGAAGFNATGDAMTAAGTAAEQAAIKNQGFAFAWDSLLGSIETFQIIVGGALLPILTQLVNDALIPAVNQVTEFATAIMNSDDPVAALVAKVTELFPAFAPLIPVIQQIAGLIADNLMPILVGVAGVLGGVVVVAIAGMVASFLTIAAPVAAAIAIVAAMYAAYQSNFAGMRDIVNSVINAISAVITSVMSAISAFWESNGAGIVQMTENIWNDVTEMISAAVELVSTVLTKLAGFIQSNQQAISNIINGAWVIITSIFSGAIQVITGIFQAFTGLLTGDSEQLSTGLKNIFEGLWTALYGIVAGGAQLIHGLIVGLASGIAALVTNFDAAARGIGQAIIDGIVNAVKAGVGALKDAVTGAANSALNAAKAALGIHSPSTEMFAVGTDTMSGWINAVIAKTPDLINSVANAANGIVQAARGEIQHDSGIDKPSGTNTSGSALGDALNSLISGGSKQEFNITAVYKKTQSETSLKDDIKMLSALNGKAAG